MKQRILIIDAAAVYRESLRIVLKDNYSVSVNPLEGDIEKLIDDNQAEIVIIGSDKSFDKAITDFRNISNILKHKSLILIFPEKYETLLPYVSLNRMRFLPRKAESVLAVADVVSALVEETAISKSFPAVAENKKMDDEIWIDMFPFIRTFNKEYFLESAKTTLPLFFRAENGMRGEDVAKMIHHYSPMDRFPFAKLSGYDADDKGIYPYIKDGLFEKDCICGTLFIENIDALSRKLKQDIVTLINGVNNSKLFGKEIRNINVRIIASAFCGLKKLLEKKNISEELYYRFSAGDFYLCPLREKSEEIPGIVKKLSSFFSYKYSMPDKKFSSSAVDLMQKYIWPANIDELISVIQRSMLFSKSDIIDENGVMFMPVKSEYSLTSVKKGNGYGVNAVDENYEGEKKGDSEKSMKADLSPSILINLAHEIKNPLVGIKTFASLLPEKYDDFEFRNDFFQIVNSDVDKIDFLIERIMQYENINNGIAEPISVKDIVNEIIEEKKEIFNEKKLSVKTELEKENLSITCSRGIFKYSVENLMFSIIGYCTQGNIVNFIARTASKNGSETKVELEISVDGEPDNLNKKSDELEEISVLLAKKAVGIYDGTVLYLKKYKNIFGYVLSMDKSE